MPVKATSKNQDQRPLERLPKKLIRYAEILATGLHTKSAAARLAGYGEGIARSHCHGWLGESPQDSGYPHLWPYYESLRKKNLRAFDVQVETVRRELALIAFSDVTKFIDLPKVEYEKRAAQARKIRSAQAAVYTYEMDQAAYLIQQQKLAKGQSLKKNELELKKPRPASDEDIELVGRFEELSQEQQDSIMIWLGYQSGSIRLKNAEEIPAELTPAIAEIQQTKDGIKLKLHDKGAALDRLARVLGMYTPAPEGEEGNVVTSISFELKGAASPLLKALQDQIGQAAIPELKKPDVAP